MSLPVTLPVIVHDEASMQAEDMGIETDFRDAPTVEARFYTIDHVLPYPTDEESYTIVFSGGQQVMCPMACKQVIKMIEA